MPKRKSSVPAYKPSDGADFGPSLKLRPRDGRLIPFGGAADICIETRTDPTVVERTRLIRGARRRDVLMDLEARRVITRRMRHAAEQFLDDCSIASGATASSTEDVGFPVMLGPRVGLPERAVSAISRINAVRVSLGLNSGTVFWWVLFENRSLSDYESRFKLRNGTATTMLRDALDALDSHYHRTTGRNGS